VRGIAYIGSAVDTNKRLGEHLNPVVANRKDVSNVRLQNALEKHALDDFIFILAIPRLENENNKTFLSRLLAREQFYLDRGAPYDVQYNISREAGSRAGSIVSP